MSQVYIILWGFEGSSHYQLTMQVGLKGLMVSLMLLPYHFGRCCSSMGPVPEEQENQQEVDSSVTFWEKTWAKRLTQLDLPFFECKEHA